MLPPPTSATRTSRLGQVRFDREDLLGGQEGQAVLLGLVDDLQVDARGDVDAVEEGVAVGRLAHRARGHGPDAVGIA